jgi:hypothetical protein
MLVGSVGTLRRAIALAALLVASAAAPLAAQPAARGGRGAPMDSAQRAELERQFHARVAEIVQRELKLTPEQTRQLESTTQRFEGQRRPLFQREIQLRRALRGELRQGEAADGARVDAYLRELLQLQRRRLDVVEAEQRSLGEFLSPVQRARYMALQENLRARVEQQRSRPGRPGPGRGDPPG